VSGQLEPLDRVGQALGPAPDLPGQPPGALGQTVTESLAARGLLEQADHPRVVRPPEGSADVVRFQEPLLEALRHEGQRHAHGDRVEPEEIAQDAFLRVLERWDPVGSLDNPESYVFRTAMNVFRNRYRRAALAVRRSISVAPHAFDELAAVEDRDEVIRLLRPLPPRQRAAVVATSILDLSAEEAGRVLGMRAATVRALTSRARTRIKDEEVDPR